MSQQFVRGSEEIFESHGTDTAESFGTEKEEVKPSAVLPSGCSIDSSSVNPSNAFEHFAGRTFITSRDHYSIADNTERRVESVDQKIARLKCEVNELFEDLAAASAGDANVSWQSLTQETSQLLLLLEQLPTNTTDLDLVTFRASDNAPTPAPANSTSGSNDVFTAVEKRVAALETALGVQTFSAPLLTSLARLERHMLLLETGQTDSIRAKLQILKAELDEVAKDNKSAKGNGAKILDAAKRLQELYDKVSSLDAVMSSIPALIMRLKSLQSIHRDAASVVNRLTALESAAEGVNKHLIANSAVLAELTKGFEENMSTLTSNMQQMELRVSALEK